MRMVMDGGQVDDLFGRIGAFLAEHRLSPEPAHYSFAYLVLSDPEGPLAQAVTSITDGGIRLSRMDIEAMGGEAVAGAPVAFDAVVRSSAAITATPDPTADGLIARTQMQVEGFVDTMRTMQVEATGFGRDLAESAAAMRRAGPAAGIDEIARLTGAMIARVHSAEVRLANATREADDLRIALDEARGSARQDPLTGLPNRRAFDETFDALPVGTPVTIAICDIDHFKRVNDVFGHTVGDRVLKAIGQTLAEACEGHLVTRYGGEEFALLFENGDCAAVAEFLDVALRAVAARRFRSRDTNELIGSVTVSAGLASGVAGAPKVDLITRADAALYRAKADGRDRVVCAPDVGV
ncbi:GGDEF domain-containing protein [Sphingomonas sp. SUN019]|uniref:GGDEF domain-containing protein n=1 Tax=Sphingomonas sp. SUN019 TaxID=2937788 RepID=UPI00216488EE|nr:GGDEF domain-containing protein [Sphingomonas sp. SUN019]UVO51334.1 GGDEF domain-containing protein [Sphingomonas sp. SUN019]